MARWRNTLGRETNGFESAPDVYESAVRIMGEIVTADVRLAAIAEEGGLTQMTETVGSSRALADILEATDIPLRVLEEQHPCVIDDLTHTRGATAAGQPAPDSGPTSAGAPLRSLLVAPVGERGILLAGSETADAFTEEQLAEIVDLASIISGVLDGLEEPTGDAQPDIDRLSSIIAHDMKSPLNVAKGRMELALGTGETGEIARAIRALDRLERLVDGLSLISRDHIQAESREVVELADLVDEAWSTVRDQDATIEIVESDQIVAAASLAGQLLTNLFSNAVEHGGPSVTIRAGMLEDGFYIEDDGPGIPAERRNEVFDWRVSSKPSHSGLGLAIVDRIVQAHGWDIEITDSECGGARFEITGVELL